MPGHCAEINGVIEQGSLRLFPHTQAQELSWGDVFVFNETYFLAPLPFLHPGQGCPPEAQGSLS